MAALADVNVGFKGQVSSAETPTIFGKGSRYSVEGAGHLKVTIGGGGDRAVMVAAGTAWGDGVLSKFDTSTVLNASANATGSDRWDTVVIRREWTPAGTPTGTATLMILSGGTSRAISTARTTDRGMTTSDQPLALIRIASGAGTVAEVVDIRCWAGDGGLVAAHIDARQYLNDPGTRMRIGGDTWTRIINGSGSAEWSNDSLAGPQVETGNFTSFASGWSLDAPGTSAIVRNGRHRSMFLEIRRQGASIAVGSTGHVANQAVRFLGEGDKPAFRVVAAGSYRSPSGGDAGCTLEIEPGGAISLASATPGVDIPYTEPGNWTLRVYAEWYVG